jgi:peptide/nickel transport system substrate-binding protein
MKRLFIVAVVAILVASMAPVHSQGGVTFNVGMQDEPKTLNPFQAQDVWDWNVMTYFYEGLLTYRPVDFKIVPNVALEVPQVSSDVLDYTIKIRNDVKWSDGTPLTAHDYALFGNMVKEFQIGRYLSSWEFVDTVEALDDTTLHFVLSECRVTFIEGTLMSLPIPSHIWEPKLAEFRAAENPTKALQEYQPVEPDEILSCGPTIFMEWQRGSYVKCKKNPNYYDYGRTHVYDDGTQLVHGPYFDYIVYRIYDTTDAAILGLKKGEIDYIWWAIQPGYVSDLLADPKITVTNNPENGMRYMAFNCAREPFSNLAFRQAVATLVDRDFIQARVLQNYGEALYSMVPPGNRQWYNPDVKKWGYGMSMPDRVLEAVSILKADGSFSWDVEPTVEEGTIVPGEGMKYKGEYIKSFVILTPPADYDPLRAMSGMLIQEWLKQIGLPVTAQPTAFGTVVQKAMGERDYDMFILGWSLTIYPDYLRDFFHSSQIMEYGYNIPQYSNPEFDRLADDLVTCGPREEKIQAAFRLQEFIAEEVPYVPLFAPAAVEAYRNDHFTGWFDELDGIADSIMYIKPVAVPEETPKPTTPAAEEEGGGLCLGTLFVALAVIGGSAVYLKRRN